MDKASKCMSRGELDAALKLYLHIFDNDPQDWSVGNMVGDLYVKMGKPGDAVTHFTMLAEQLAADGFAAKARALYRKIVRLQPGNEDARRRVDELDRQTAGEASPFLKRVLETARNLRNAPAAPEPPVVVAAPEPPIQVAAPEPPPAPIAAPAPPAVAVAASAATAPADAVGDAYRLAESAASAAAARGDHAGAAAIVERFLADHPRHVLALEFLVDIAVEGGLERELVAAQERLADACLAARHFRQAFDIAVDLRTRYPRDTRHHEQLGRIVEIARTHGRAFVIPPMLESEPEPAPPVVVNVPPPVVAAVPVTPVRPPAPAPAPPPAAAPAPVFVPPQFADTPAAPTGGSIAIGPPFGDLLKEWSDPDRPLEDVRNSLLEEAAAIAEEGFAQAVKMVTARRFADAWRPLEEAMCLPHLRVAAGAELARVSRDTGEPVEAMAILEWVAEMPPVDEESGHRLAYELALTLESLGQETQALGVYRELLAEVGPEYLDIATRVQRLAAA